MDLEEFVRRNPSLSNESTADQVLAIAWFWRTHQATRILTFLAMEKAFKDIGLNYTNLAKVWGDLYSNEPKQLIIITHNNYKLSLPTLIALDQKYALCKEHQQTIEVKKLLTDLLEDVAKPEEQVYLNETIICFENKAFRAAVVMAWNLAYDHLCRYILDDQTRLSEFNKHAKSPVKVQADFSAFKESLVLQWCRAANIIEKHPMQLLEHGLTRRNMAAHPSDVTTSSSNAESTIEDLVKQVIHKYPLL